jgi:hypothetical protein
MPTNVSPDVTGTWQVVSEWPTRQRLELATRILQSLVQENEPVEVPSERQAALRRLIGIWKTEHPLTDDDVDRLLEEDRTRRHQI